MILVGDLVEGCVAGVLGFVIVVGVRFLSNVDL